MATEHVTIRDGEGMATVSLSGAELRSWQVDGADLLWSGDPTHWGAIAPVLFPVVGWTRHGEARVDGVTYPLGLHGFAKDSDFSVVGQGHSSVTLRLADDSRTHALYPFRFRFDVTFVLAKSSLSATFDVTNTGDRPMPYACGWHPGLMWPLPGGQRAGQAVTFEEAEEPRVPVIAPGGLFSPRTRPLSLEGEGRVLPLDEDSFAREALCFIGAQSRSLVFGDRDGKGPAVEARFDGLPNIVLWSRPAAPFLCIEGWSGMGDPEAFAGSLFEKPGMIVLAPGETRRHAMLLIHRPAGAIGA